MWFPPAEGRFLSDYGPRDTGIPGASTFHRGIDIAPPIPGQHGRPVVAASDGTVIGSGFSSVRGWWIVIRHSDGSATRSQHLEGRGTSRGVHVSAGHKVGIIGETGVASGEHLHFETFNPGADWTSSRNAVDPEPFMRARGVNLRTAVLVSNPLWTSGGLPTLAPSKMPDPITPTVPEEDIMASLEQVEQMLDARTPCQAYRLAGAAGIYRDLGTGRRHISGEQLAAIGGKFVDLDPNDPFWDLPIVGNPGELLRRKGNGACWLLAEGSLEWITEDRLATLGTPKPVFTDLLPTHPVWKLPTVGPVPASR